MAEEYEPLTAENFEAATEVFKKEGDAYNMVDKPKKFEEGLDLHVKKAGGDAGGDAGEDAGEDAGGDAAASTDRDAGEDAGGDAAASTDRDAGEVSNNSHFEVSKILILGNKSTRAIEIENLKNLGLPQELIDQLPEDPVPATGAAGQTPATVEGGNKRGRRRTKRKGRKGSKKSKKGAKKSKRSAKQSKKGGRSSKNRRKQSRRRKH